MKIAYLPCYFKIFSACESVPSIYLLLKYAKNVIKQHTLTYCGYQVLGTPIQAIVDTEDRARFSQRLDEINEHAARSASATTVDQAVQIVCACA